MITIKNDASGVNTTQRGPLRTLDVETAGTLSNTAVETNVFTFNITDDYGGSNPSGDLQEIFTGRAFIRIRYAVTISTAAAAVNFSFNVSFDGGTTKSSGIDLLTLPAGTANALMVIQHDIGWDQTTVPKSPTGVCFCNFPLTSAFAKLRQGGGVSFSLVTPGQPLNLQGQILHKWAVAAAGNQATNQFVSIEVVRK